MLYVTRPARWLASLAVLLGLAVAGTVPAGAQTPMAPALPDAPQWMIDSTFIGGYNSMSKIIVPLLQNRYLTLWQYRTGDELTRFNLWTNEGDPLNSLDNYALFRFPDPASPQNLKWDTPFPLWGGSQLIASRRPDAVGNARPFGNFTTLRVEDPAEMNGFADLTYPDDGANRINPPIVFSPNGQGTFAPYRYSGGTGVGAYDLEVNQKLQFARDLLRIEYTVTNRGGSARRVGVRLLLNTAIDIQGSTRSFFIPRTRERILFERDYGRAIGTTVVPRSAQVPEEWEIFNFDESPNPSLISKGILRGNGATTPDRVVFGNALNMERDIAGGQLWDYAIEPEFELRISDMALLIYWDPISVPAGQTRTFVTYAGMGVASHGMSNAYIQASNNTGSTGQGGTQGYIAAVQSPFALRLLDLDRDQIDDPDPATVTAYIQNEYANTQLPSAFAVIDLPDGLEFTNPGQSQVLSLGSPLSVGDVLYRDETSNEWTVQANGEDAGLLPISVTFNNGFQDSVRVVRLINVPQGRLYQLDDEYQMVTFPFTYRNLADDPSDVLGLTPGTFQMLRYNPQTGQYEQVTQVQAGESYWVKLLGLGRTRVNVKNASPINLQTNDTFTTQVIRGWNMVGNPSPYAIPVRDLRFLQTGGQLLSFDQAVSSNLIRAGLFEYNKKTGQYVALSRESIIQPGHGVWIFSNGERNIVWPPPQGPQISILP